MLVHKVEDEPGRRQRAENPRQRMDLLVGARRSERCQVFRLLKAYPAEGATRLISKRRGGRSNRRKPETLRQAALALMRERYWDLGPTPVQARGRFWWWRCYTSTGECLA
jgi:hypothetical protein